MQENTPYKPDALDFLEMWKHFNQLAHESGVVKTALSKYDQPDSAWLNYYLYFNPFQVIGQTLLVYCLREILDIAATHEFSDFDLTGYLLEPEQEYHDEAAGVLRQALEDEDILQFASVRNHQELSRMLELFLDAEGSLKVLVLPEVDSVELQKYLDKVCALFEQAAMKTNSEFVVLVPSVRPENEVCWHYMVFNQAGASALDFLEKPDYSEVEETDG